MELLTAVAISVGILSGVWAWISASFGLITWVGFIGCTSYFASGGKFKGLKKSILANLSGVLWAMCIILGTKYLGGTYISYILTGFFSFVMCIQAKGKLLEFIPGAFCGACATFGAGGNWSLVIISLICGGILGHVSDIGGTFLSLITRKKEF